MFLKRDREMDVRRGKMRGEDMHVKRSRKGRSRKEMRLGREKEKFKTKVESRLCANGVAKSTRK